MDQIKSLGFIVVQTHWSSLLWSHSLCPTSKCFSITLSSDHVHYRNQNVSSTAWPQEQQLETAYQVHWATGNWWYWLNLMTWLIQMSNSNLKRKNWVSEKWSNLVKPTIDLKIPCLTLLLSSWVNHMGCDFLIHFISYKVRESKWLSRNTHQIHFVCKYLHN